MNSYQAMVDTFHERFGLQRPNKPDFANLQGELRIRLMQEELDEFKGAWERRDPVGMLDGLCDLLYVTFGSLVSAGVDADPYFEEVHSTNMKKLGPDGQPLRREDGKLLKPPGWKPPDLAGIFEDLRRESYPPKSYSPVRGHSTNPRAEPQTVGEWQAWAETLQADMEGQAERIQELEKALDEERASVKRHREEEDRLNRALKETEAANADALKKNGRLLNVYKAAASLRNSHRADGAQDVQSLFDAVRVIEEREP